MQDEKIKIFAIGASGLVGSRIQELLSDKYDFQNLSLETGVNITDPATLDVIRNDMKHEIVLHLAAKADVDGCEKDKPLGENGDAYKININGTLNVVNACRESNKKIIYISTDFVFDGENTPDRGYSEENRPNPVNWYGYTKYQGEEIVRNSGIPYLIVRIAYPYRQEFEAKMDFVRVFISKLKNNEPLTVVDNHIMTPTFMDDIAYALDALIKHKSTGIYHVVGSQSLSPYDAALMVAKKIDANPFLVTKTTRSEFFKDRAQRPFNIALNNDKIQKLGVKMRSFEEGLREF